MVEIKLRKRLKKDTCPPKWCPLKKRPGCCIDCKFHIEKGDHVVYCSHKDTWKKK